MNKGLRILTNIKDMQYLRLPFSDLFFSIKDQYEKQINADFRQKNSFNCYRGGNITEEEVKVLKENVDGYIELEGFMSSSLAFDRMHNFIGNLLVEITVNQDALGGELDNGFAYIS